VSDKVLVVLVGEDAARLGALAARLTEEHGRRVAVCVGDPADDATIDHVVAMADELSASRGSDA
jgi:hypothetical protein